MKIESKLFNRFAPPSDGWIHLAPFGKHPHEAGLQVVDEDTISTMVENFQKAGKRPLLIDYDHKSHDLKNTTEAAGWIEDIEGREDGLWGKVRWSEDGETKIKNGSYRFVSPVWLVTQGIGKKEDLVYPTELKDVALTNQPNLKGLVPVSNRDQIEPFKPKKDNSMKNIAKSLGLDSEATEVQIIEAVNRLQKESENKGNRVLELETEVQNSRRTEADTIAKEHGIEGDQKKSFVETFVSNREVAMKVLEVIPKASRQSGGAQPLTNRDKAKTPDFTPGSQDNAAQAKAEQDAVKVYNRAKEIQSKEGLNWNMAFSQAQSEVAVMA